MVVGLKEDVGMNKSAFCDRTCARIWHVSLCVVLLGIGTLATQADVTYTGADPSAPLDLSLVTNWSVAPTADDEATVPMSLAPGTAFVLSGDLSVKGLSFTSVSAAFSLAGPGRLTLGASGITSSAGKSFTLTAPVTTTAAQSWNFQTSAGIFTCGTKISGTADLAWTAYSITVSEPPEYGGKLTVTSKNAWDSYFKITKKGKIAETAVLNGHFYPTFGGAYSPRELVGDGRLILGGWNHPYFNEAVLNIGDGEQLSHGGDYADFIKGSANQSGGDVILSGRIMLGRPFWGGKSSDTFTYSLSGGQFQSVTTRTETTSLILGYRNNSGKAAIKFNQTGGTLKMRNGVYVGGIGGTATTIGEYDLCGGLFVPVRPTSEEANGYCAIDRHGLIFASKEKTGTSGTSDPMEATTAAGVFTQRGGTSDITRVRWGYAHDSYDADTFASNCEGFGIFSLLGGVCKLGTDGFCVHAATWNQDAAGETVMPHDSTYRIRLNGGTLQPKGPLVNKLQWEIEPSADPKGFTLDATNGDIDLIAPVWGAGDWHKSGSGLLRMADASRFTGSLTIDEGEAEVRANYADVWEEAADLVFKADDVVVAMGTDAANGVAVESWPATQGEVVAGPVQGYKVGTREYVPPQGKTTLALNAFGTHAGLKFKASGFEVPANRNPVSDSQKWTAVVVFKDSVGGYSDAERTSYDWAFGRLIMGNVMSGEWQNNEWAIGYPNKSGDLSNVIIAGMGWLYQNYTHATAPRGGVNDGKAHVAICAQDDTWYSVNVDGGFVSNRVVTLHANAKTSKRLSKPLYIGFAQMLESGGVYDGCGFQGTIAEIRFYRNRVLSEQEQNGLARALRAKYGVDQLTQTRELAHANGGGAEGGLGSTASVPALPSGANVWSADALGLEDGAAVETWTSDTAIAATQATGNGTAAPTLVKKGLNGKAVVRFDADNRTVLGVAAAKSPISGRTAVTAAVVFRTTTDGTGENQARYGRGLVSTVNGTSAAEDFAISLEKEGSIYGLYGSASGSAATWTRKPCRLADGTPHIVILSGDQEADTLVQMTDGLACRKTTLTTAAARANAVLYFGGSATGATDAKCFTGDIAEIVVWDRALTETEMTAATENLAAKYKIRSLAKMPFAEEQIDTCGLSATNITVAAGATLRLPISKSAPFTLTDAKLSGEGRVLGSVRFAAGSTADLSALPAIEDLQLADGSALKLDARVLAAPVVGISSITGHVTIDLTAVAEALPKKSRWPIIAIDEAAVEGATFEVVGAGRSVSVEYSEQLGALAVCRQLGCTLIFR